MHHLRESGEIEFEADVVAFLVRPAWWSKQEAREAPKGSEPPDDQAVWCVDKNRNGEVGQVRLRWCASRTLFESPDEPQAYDEFAQFGGDEF